MCIYGIELLDGQRRRVPRRTCSRSSPTTWTSTRTTTLHQAAANVLSLNIVHGDALTMLTSDGEPITFAEWGYLGKGKFQRRDFRFDILTQMSSFGEDTLFADLGKHEVFTPVKTFPPMNVAELAA